jgi:hypothetical protein
VATGGGSREVRAEARRLYLETLHAIVREGGSAQCAIAADTEEKRLQGGRP